MTLNCIVCSAEAAPYFSKEFGVLGLSTVDYWRCPRCGLVVSKTHFDMSAEEWGALNAAYHRQFFGTDHNEDDARWMERLSEQRRAFNGLAAQGALLRKRPWVDYGCGDGKLADFLAEDGMKTSKFDRFMTGPGFLAEREMTPGGFDVVINTSVMEHVRDRGALDEIAGLVSPDGVLALHTLVREEIPPDPSWFYLLPVHTVFYTNKAMETLFEQWSLSASLYDVPARMWFMYRNADSAWDAAVRTADGVNTICKLGFVDYWR